MDINVRLSAIILATLPADIPGIKWSTSNKDIISKTGRISRMSASTLIATENANLKYIPDE